MDRSVHIIQPIITLSLHYHYTIIALSLHYHYIIIMSLHRDIITESAKTLAIGGASWITIATDAMIKLHYNNLRRIAAAHNPIKMIKLNMTMFDIVIISIYERINSSWNVIYKNPRYFPIWTWIFICYMHGRIINSRLRKDIYKLLYHAYYNDYVTYRDAVKCMYFIDRKSTI